MSLDRTQTFVHQYANDFDAIYGNQNGMIDSVINRFFRKSMRLRYEKSIEGCEPVQGKSVLDIGCGPGHYSITLAQRGAARVVGIDFAEGMLKLATEHARQVGVADRCHFQVADFYQYPPEEQFDYVIVMGFMDYMPDPEKVIAKVLSLTRNKAFFSFPVAGGILGWQRKLRYQKRCDLFLYTAEQLQRIFAKFPEATAKVESISRDYFVTLTRNGKKV
jgi:2-polyprenyl-3-methyl-5-hydroxy-6-metoxy-1,4-benzoquinol methylase